MDRSNNPAAKRNKKVVVENFKGLETVIDSSELGLNVADKAENVSWELDGGISKREGSSVSKTLNNELSYVIKRTVSMIDRVNEGVGSIISAAAGKNITDEVIKRRNLKIEGAHTFLFEEGGKLQIGGVTDPTDDKKFYPFKDYQDNEVLLPADSTAMIGVLGHDYYSLIAKKESNPSFYDIFLINESSHVFDETHAAVHDGDWSIAQRISKILDHTITNVITNDQPGYHAPQYDYFSLKTVEYIEMAGILISMYGNYSGSSSFIVYPGAERYNLTLRPDGTGGTMTGTGGVDGGTMTGIGGQVYVPPGGGTMTGGIPPLYPGTISKRATYAPGSSTIIPGGTNSYPGGITGGGTGSLGGEVTSTYGGVLNRGNSWGFAYDGIELVFVNYGSVEGKVKFGLCYLDNKLGGGDGQKEIKRIDTLQQDAGDGSLDGRAMFWGLGKSSHKGIVVSIHNKKMEFHTYNEGGLKYGVGTKIDVSDIAQDGAPGGTPLGELGSTLAKGVYNDDKNGLTLLDYTEDPVANTSTVTFACAIKRDNSAVKKVDKKYQGLDIYEVKYTYENGAVSGGSWKKKETIRNSGNLNEARFMSSKYIKTINVGNPRIFHDTLRNIYMIDDGGTTGFVNNFSTGAIEIPEGRAVHSFTNKLTTGTIEYGIYDKNLAPLTKGTINHGATITLHDDIKRNVKYIVNLSDDPYALENLDIFDIGVTTSQTTEIKNWIRNSDKVIGETIDLTCAFGKKDEHGNVKLEIFYDDDKIAKILGIGGVNSVDNEVVLQGDVIDWTYINDSIIVTTEQDNYVITAIKTEDSGKEVIFCYVNSIFDMAKKITYIEATTSGLNVLAETPLKIVKDEIELKSNVNYYEDIIITNLVGEIALNIEPGEKYRVYPQFKYKDGGNTPRFNGGWSLEHFDEAQNSWVADTTLDITADPDQKFVEIGPFTKGGKYRVKSIAKIHEYNQDGSVNVGVDKEFKKTLTFNVSSLNSDVHIGDNLVAEEIRKCKYVTTLEGRLVFYGNGTKQIYTSEVNDPFYFTASEIVVGDSFGKSEDIVSINTFKDTQVIFTNTTMMSMTRRYLDNGNSFWAILPLDGTIGAINHKGVCPIENSLSFVGYNGIYLIGQISVAEKRVQLITISEPIRDIVETDISPENHVSSKTMEDINASNLEKRLFVSYPSKGYMVVYDYNNAENMAQGKWSVWKGMVPYHMEVFNNELFFLQRRNDNGYTDSQEKVFASTIFRKNKRLYTNTYEKVHNVAFYFTDFHDESHTSEYLNGLTRNVKFLYESKESALEEQLKYKKIKRISVTTDNTYGSSTNYIVTTIVDGHEDWIAPVANNAYLRPTDDGGDGFMTLGQTITNFFEKENVNSISNMKSKNGLVSSIKIEEYTKNPFSVKRIYMEFLTSNVKRFKYKNISNVK